MAQYTITIENPGMQFLIEKQRNLYKNLREYSKAHPYIGRLGAIPIAIIDICLEDIKHLSSLLTEIFLKVHNLFFQPKRHLKYSNGLLADIGLVIGYVAVSPFFILKKTWNILSDPTSAETIQAFPYDTPVFKG